MNGKDGLVYWTIILKSGGLEGRADAIVEARKNWQVETLTPNAQIAGNSRSSNWSGAGGAKERRDFQSEMSGGPTEWPQPKKGIGSRVHNMQ